MSKTVKLTDSSTTTELQAAELPAVEVGDGELLELYVLSNDHEALETLIERYSKLVACVCRLTTGNAQDAEDAFQATFLVLIRSAKKIRKKNSLASWLHGVAYRNSVRLRTKRKKMLSGHEPVEQSVNTNEDPVADMARSMQLEALDRELQELPESTREPLIEHYLLGYSAPQIAERMELSVSAVEGRLKRGRHALRRKLARRGISLSILLASSAWFSDRLMATDANQWTETFLNHLEMATDGVSAADSSPVLDTPESLSHLTPVIEGELAMLTTLIPKAAWATGIIAATSVALLAITQLDQSQGVAGTPLQLDAPPATQVEEGGPTILGQMGPMTQPPVARPPSTPGTTESAPQVTWRKPTESDSPNWLEGGNSTAQKIEEIRNITTLETDFDFQSVPLVTAMRHLSEQLNVQIEIDFNELDLAGTDPQEPVTGSGNASVREVFRRTLNPLELTYRITPSTIEITTLDSARSNPTLRFYDLSYVLPNTSNLDSLMNALQSSVNAEDWEVNGGDCTMTNVGSLLIVTATESMHEQIELILSRIAQVDSSNISQSVPVNPGGGMMGGMVGGRGTMGGGMF